MKIVIKISLLISFFLCSIAAVNAQYIPKKRLTVDIRAGVNISEMDMWDAVKEVGVNKFKQPKIGLNLGINVNYKLIDNFQFQTGFLVTKKGLKQHIKKAPDGFGASDPNIYVLNYSERRTTTGNYLQVPFNLGYELYVTKLWAFNINAGAYLAYGYKGKGDFATEVTYRNGPEGVDPVTDKSDGEYDTFTPDMWKRLDYGLNAHVGVIYDIYTFIISYEYGLYNISRSNPELKNRNFSASIGFRF
ncbi:MAG: PorT family protein [Prevotella sp.]|jgi:hypothetical protein|nr:PorT family protein [Prevotella sp.]